MLSKELKEILEIIPVRELRNLAEQNQLNVTGNRHDLIKRIESVISDVDVLELWEQYQDAGSVTIHFTLMGTDSYEEFKTDPILYLGKIGIDKYIDTPTTLTEFTLIPKLHKIIKRKQNFILYFIRRGKEEEFYLSHKIENNPRIQSGFIRETAKVILSQNNSLIQIRCRGRQFAKSIFNIIEEWFPDSELLHFTKKNALYWINTEESKLTNIRFKVLGENLSSISLTAPKKGDLKQEEKLLTENFDRGSCSGFYINADMEVKGQNKNIGLLFNVNEGKIYFRSYSSEGDIEHVVSKLIESLGL